MNEKLFTIAPLVWKKELAEDWVELYQSNTIFGEYFVQRKREDDDARKKWEGWVWGYSFDESGFMDDAKSCKSLSEGKREAMKHWAGRLSLALVPFEPKKKRV